MIIMDCEVVEELGIREKIGMPGPLENPTDTNGAHQVKQEETKAQPGSISSNNFYGEKPQQPAAQKALPTRSNASGAGTSSYGNIYPIEALSPYAHRWTIKVRCTSKGEIKTWHKPSSEGKLFSANFLDESGEIRATGFNESVDQLYNVIQEGQVYYISTPCRVTIAKKQFSNLSNDYELSFERDTVVEKAEDPDSVPKVQYNFTNISDLEKVQKDATVDTIGILESVGEVQEITSKNTGKPYQKRELNLVDDTHFSVRLTIWGNTAQSFDATPESVVAFKGLKVGDFGGRSLSLLSSGSVAVDPDIDEAYKLKGLYDAQGRTDKYTSHAETMGSTGASTRQQNYKTISQVREEQLGMGEEATYFALKAIVVFVKSDTGFSYPGCRTSEPQKCNKKVTEVDPGQWRCEKCDRTWDRPEYRYIMSVNVQDYTGQLWLSCFDEVGRQLIGASADEMQEMRENEDPKFQERVQDANCNLWVFRVRAKMDTYNDQQRYVAHRFTLWWEVAFLLTLWLDA